MSTSFDSYIIYGCKFSKKFVDKYFKYITLQGDTLAKIITVYDCAKSIGSDRDWETYNHI